MHFWSVLSHKMKSKIKTRKIQSKLNKLKNKNFKNYNEICKNISVVYDNAYIESHKTYGFIYLTINNANGKCYIGRKIAHNGNKKYEWENYLGSGKLLMLAVEKYGRVKFVRLIIDVADNFDELNEKEIYWIAKFNADKSNNFYNISKGGEANTDKSGVCHPVYCITNRKFYLSSEIASKDTGDDREKILHRCSLTKRKNVLVKYKETGEMPEIRQKDNPNTIKNDYCFIEYAHVFIFKNKALNGCNICYDFENKILYRSPKATGFNNGRIMTKQKYKEYLHVNKKVKRKIIRVKDYLRFNNTLDLSNITIFDAP